MKKLFVLLFLLIPSLAFGAIHTDVQWEVDINGSADAGCGFREGASGTDYSDTEVSVHSTRTDLVIGSAGSEDELSSAADNFASDDIGNLVKITAGSGFTTGYYEVLSVAAGVATMDRSVGTADSTSGTGVLGGACNHPEDVDDSVVAGNTIWIAAGTYLKQGADTTILDIAVAGSSTGDIRWVGYNTTRGDAPTLTDRPLFDCNDDTATGFNSEDGTSLENINIADCTSHGVNSGNCSTGACWLINVRVFSAGADGVNGEISTFGTEIDLSADNAFELAASNAMNHWYGYWHDNSDRAAANCTSCASNHYFSIADTNTVGGFTNGRTPRFLIGNVAYNNGGTGIQCGVGGATSWQTLCYNNIAHTNTTYGIDCATAGSEANLDFNIAYNNGTDFNNCDTNSVELTTDPTFTAPATGDFTLQDDSPAEGAAFPTGAQLGLTGSYMWNIGMSQDDKQTGGAGTNATGAVSVGF